MAIDVTGTDPDARSSDKQVKQRWLDEHEKDRSDSLLAAWLLGVVLAAKAGLALIAVSSGDFSLTLLTTPIFFVLWIRQLDKWRNARRKVAKLRSELPGYQPPDNSQLGKLFLVCGVLFVAAVVASLLLSPAG